VAGHNDIKSAGGGLLAVLNAFSAEMGRFEAPNDRRAQRFGRF